MKYQKQDCSSKVVQGLAARGVRASIPTADVDSSSSNTEPLQTEAAREPHRTFSPMLECLKLQGGRHSGFPNLEYARAG